MNHKISFKFLGYILMIYLNGSYFISINFEFKEILDKTRLRIKGKNSVIDIRIVQKFGSKRQSGITTV